MDGKQKNYEIWQGVVKPKAYCEILYFLNTLPQVEGISQFSLLSTFTLWGRLVLVRRGEVVPQLATEPVEPKPDADILPRHCKSLIASVSHVRASAIGSS